MADTENRSADTTASQIQQAKKTASKIAQIAHESKGNWVAAAASAAKEAIKDPEWAAKTVMHVAIFTVLPLFLIVCIIFNFGAAMLSYVIDLVKGALEEAAVDTGGSVEGIGLRTGFNIIKGLLGGNTKEITKTITDRIANEYSDEFFSGHTDEKGNALGDGVDNSELDDEYSQTVDKDAARRVFWKRLTMVKNSAQSRYDQYMDRANDLAVTLGFWSNFFFKGELENKIHNYISTSNYEILDAEVIVPDNEISDIDCAAILALFSAQTNQDINNVQIMDLRYWLGMYSRLESIFVKEVIEPSEDPIVDMSNVPVSVSNGSEAIINADLENLREATIKVERWHGTFVPQYVLEQYRQDINADQILSEDSTASQEEKDAATKSKMGTANATYPKSVGLIDEYMKYTGLSCSLVITTDTDKDISYIKPVISVGVRAVNQYELGTDIAGLWSGPLQNTDTFGKNRVYNNPAYPNLLSKTWTDSRGATYERQEPYQYEYYLDMLKGYIDEYHLAGEEQVEDFGGIDFGAGDGNAIVAEANRIYNAYHNQPSSVQRNYVWSEYNHRQTQSTLAWCCAFVYVCADHCGYIGKGNVFGPNMFAWCAYSRDFFDRQGRATRDPNYKPKPGDIIYFYNEGSSGIAHVGIVEYYDEETGKVHTIEGNCGDKFAKNAYNAAPDTFLYWTTVDGVKKRRLIWGYASPNYPIPEPDPAAPPSPEPVIKTE